MAKTRLELKVSQFPAGVYARLIHIRLLTLTNFQVPTIHLREGGVTQFYHVYTEKISMKLKPAWMNDTWSELTADHLQYFSFYGILYNTSIPRQQGMAKKINFYDFPFSKLFLLPSSDFPLKGYTGMAAFFTQALNSKKLSRTSLSCEVTLFPEGKVWYVRRFSGEMRWRCHIALALSGGLKERGWEEQAHNGDMVISLVTDPRKYSMNVTES